MKQLLVIAILCIPTIIIAQETWSVTFSPTLHFPIRKVLGEPLRIGNGVNVTVEHTLGNHIKIYGGTIWNRFDTDQNYDEENIEFIQRGVVLGGMYFFYCLARAKESFLSKSGPFTYGCKVA